MHPWPRGETAAVLEATKHVVWPGARAAGRESPTTRMHRRPHACNPPPEYSTAGTHIPRAEGQQKGPGKRSPLPYRSAASCYAAVPLGHTSATILPHSHRAFPPRHYTSPPLAACSGALAPCPAPRHVLRTGWFTHFGAPGTGPGAARTPGWAPSRGPSPCPTPFPWGGSGAKGSCAASRGCAAVSRRMRKGPRCSAPAQGHPPRPGPSPCLCAASVSSPGAIGGTPPPFCIRYTTKTRSDPRRVRMSSGERPMGAAEDTEPNTEALCHPPPPV